MVRSRRREDMAKGKIYTVSKRKKKDGWKAKESSLGVFAKGDTKEAVVLAVTNVANLQKRATVRIEKSDGELQEERSYSRDAPLERSTG